MKFTGIVGIENLMGSSRIGKQFIETINVVSLCGDLPSLDEYLKQAGYEKTDKDYEDNSSLVKELLEEIQKGFKEQREFANKNPIVYDPKFQEFLRATITKAISENPDYKIIPEAFKVNALSSAWEEYLVEIDDPVEFKMFEQQILDAGLIISHDSKAQFLINQNPNTLVYLSPVTDSLTYRYSAE